MESYSRSFQDPRRARGYGEKFRKGLFRRWTHSKEAANLQAALEEASALGEMDLVLDVPCGAGRWAGLLKGAGRTYLGLDLSLPMLRICREREGLAGSTIQASAWALPLPDGGADLTACIRLLHHVREEEEKRALLGELCRVTAKALLVTFLDGQSPKQRLHRKKARILGRPLRRPSWTRGALEKAARERGFAPVRYWSLSPWFSGQTLALLEREARS